MKRFAETSKWDDGWYRRLSPLAKCLWQFLCDKCDSTGVVEIDYESATFCIGALVTEEIALEIGDRIVPMANGKYFIPKFVFFQYGELSEACPAHKPIYRKAKEHGFLVVEGRIQYPSATLCHRLAHSLQDKKGKEEERKGEGECEGKDKVLRAAIGIAAKEAPPVELPRGFPETAAAAMVHADFVGCPPVFAETTWTKASSRGGRDAKDVPIRSFRHYLANEWVYERGRIEKDKKNGGKPNGTQNRRTHVERVDRNIGTCNEGSAADYRGMGTISSLPDVPGSST